MTTEVVAPPSGLRYAFSSLRHRDYALFWSAGAVSNTGGWMQNVTVPYVIYEMTKSTTWLGFAAFVSFFPSVIMGPVSGALADRFSRKSILVVTNLVGTLVALALWVLWVTDTATPLNIVAVLFVGSVAVGVMITSWQAFVPALVPQAELLNAVRVNSIQFTAARAVGPALGGLVLGRFGPATAFMVNAISFLFVVGALLAIRPRRQTVEQSGGILEQFRAGVAYVRERRALVLAIATILAVNLFSSSIVQLAPAFATDQFHASKTGYGLLIAAYGLGAIIGAVTMASEAERARRSRLIQVGLGGAVAGLLLLAASERFGIGAVALVVMGVSYVVVTVSLNTTIQIRVEDRYRGRVVALYLMAIMGGLPVGALVLGWVVDLIGLRPTMVLSAALLAAYGVVVSMRYAGLAAVNETLEGAEPDVYQSSST